MKRREFLKVCGAAVGLTVFGGADDKPLGGLNKEIQCKGGIVSSEYLKSHDLAVGESYQGEYVIKVPSNYLGIAKEDISLDDLGMVWVWNGGVQKYYTEEGMLKGDLVVFNNTTGKIRRMSLSR